MRFVERDERVPARSREPFVAVPFVRGLSLQLERGAVVPVLGGGFFSASLSAPPPVPAPELSSLQAKSDAITTATQVATKLVRPSSIHRSLPNAARSMTKTEGVCGPPRRPSRRVVLGGEGRLARLLRDAPSGAGA